VVYLSDLPADFHTAMTTASDTDGKTIRVSTSDGTTQLACVPIGVNTGTDTGCLIFLGTGMSASVDVDYRIYVGNAALSMPSASGGMGEQAVFAAYEPQVQALETAVTDMDRTAEQRAEALRQMYAVQAERDRMANGLTNEAGLETIPDTPATAPHGEGDSTPSEIAAREMLADGYLPAVVQQQGTLSDDELRATVNDMDQQASRRRYAFEILQERGVDVGLNRAQFETREQAFANGVSGAVAMTSHGNPRELVASMQGIGLDALRRIGNSNDTVAEVARAAVAFRTGQHMGNWDQAPSSSRPTALEAAPEGPYQLQVSLDRQVVDVVEPAAPLLFQPLDLLPQPRVLAGCGEE